MCRLLRKYQIGLKGKFRVCSVIDMARWMMDLREIQNWRSPLKLLPALPHHRYWEAPAETPNPGLMSKFYITFAAREFEFPDAPLVEYQAKAVWSVTHKIYPILCRPSPTPTRVCFSLLQFTLNVCGFLGFVCFPE